MHFFGGFVELVGAYEFESNPLTALESAYIPNGLVWIGGQLGVGGARLKIQMA